ncbi:MAG: sensor histidine kinase [Deferrisomatales bacterium]
MSNPLFVFVLYLLYGLVFFSMGVAVFARDLRASNQAIARPLWLFALFAFTHAFHEWLELYLLLQESFEDAPFLFRIKSLKLWPVLLSYCFLLSFGILLLSRIYPRWRRPLFLVPPLLFGLLALAVLAGREQYAHDFLAHHNYRIRNLVGFPAGLAAGLAFLAYGATVRTLSSKGANNFVWAGLFTVLYGILTGLIPSRTPLPVLIQVEVARALSALGILHFLMRGLHVFDIERQVAIEQRLQRFAQSERINALGRLASGIAHEINNPLSNVSLSVELLKRDLSGEPDTETIPRRFTVIERNLQRASKIAQELLFVSRSRDGDAVDADLNEVIRGTLTLLGTAPKGDSIDFRPGELPPIRIVLWKIEEVFLNLLVNARDVTPPGGRIVITTAAGNGHVVAEVADSGPGIAPEHRGRIFDPFFTSKEVGHGTGLGLSVSQGIMERHGGRIELKETGPGGTKMAVVFPLPGVSHDEGSAVG